MTAAAVELSPAATADAATVSNFMKGKALAAFMVRESMSRDPGEESDLCASYREPGTEQDNCTLPMLRHLVRTPELLIGFSAALSSLLVEGMERMDFAGPAATICYEACTTHFAYDEANPHDCYTAPTLDEQVRAYGFDTLAMSSAIDITDDANRAHAADEPDAWSPCSSALLVTLAMAERENEPLTWAFHRVINSAKEAIESFDDQPDDPDRQGHAHDTLQQALSMAVFLRRNRDRDMDVAAELLLKQAVRELDAHVRSVA